MKPFDHRSSYAEDQGTPFDPIDDAKARDALDPAQDQPWKDIETRLKSGVKDVFRAFGLHVCRTLPRGVSLSHDLKHAMPGHRFRLIFDVGANVGQSARRYLKEFAPERVICFEPSGSIFEELAQAFAGDGRVRCERLALGSTEGRGTLVQTVDPTMHHLTGFGPDKAEVTPTVGAEKVTVSTLDRYCASADIDFIDFLKIDTEGHDYEVIVGADELLSDERVGVLQCECSVSPENSFHVGFDTMRAHLEVKGYRLFGIYEQVHEWMARTPNLRRVNAAFVSRRFMQPQRG